MDAVINAIKEVAAANSQPLSSQRNYYLNVLNCLGYDPIHPPLANLFARYHQLAGQWLIASPIHWEATHNDAMITAIDSELELTEEESQLWFADLSQFLKDDFHWHYHDAHTWLLKVDDKPSIFSQSLYAMQHHSLMPVFAIMDKTLFWQRLMTELQMYLSSHPLNTQRQGKLTINGVWFWGQGELNPQTQRKIVTDDEVLLASLADVADDFLSTPLTKNHLIAIKYPQQIDFSHLQDKMQKYPVHWYWNNLAYLTKRRFWWPWW